MHHAHLVVHGRVQGVGYRAFVAVAARSLGIRGEVRNLPDGSVDVRAEGEDAALASFLEEARSGPIAARVEHFEVERHEGPSRHRDFRIAG